MITEASTRKIASAKDKIPLKKGWVLVFCAGCGRDAHVLAGEEEKVHEEMKAHARSHESQLAAELREQGTDGLVWTVTRALPADEWPEVLRKRREDN